MPGFEVITTRALLVTRIFARVAVANVRIICDNLSVLQMTPWVVSSHPKNLLDAPTVTG